MGYHVGPKKVWLKSRETGLEVYSVHEVVGADPKNFSQRVLKNQFGETQTLGFDTESVFWGADKIEGADLASFEYVGSEYFKDKNHAYYYSHLISDDASNFVLFDEFVKDTKNVYFAGGVFSDDAPNFARVGPVDSRYYRDSKTCWYFVSPLPGATPSLIKSLAKNYAVDDKNVFYETTPIEGAEIASFEILKSDHSRDAKGVYFQSQTILGADPGSFEIIDDRISRDKSNCYYYGYPLDRADPGSLEIIDEFYIKDASHVWLNGTLIDGADPKTFRVIAGPGGRSRDAKYEYDMYERVNGSGNTAK